MSSDGDGGVPSHSGEPHSPNVQLQPPELPQQHITVPLADSRPPSYLPTYAAVPPPPTNHTQPIRVDTQARLREEVQRKLASAIVVKCGESAKYKAPVVILASESMNVYLLLEQFFSPEVLTGAERFWKVVRNDLNLETWRPRVNGTQLKALANVHLPETEEQLAVLRAAVTELRGYLRGNATPEQFMEEYLRFLDKAEIWWEGRTRRDYAPSSAPGPKRVPAQSLAGNAYKRMNMTPAASAPFMPTHPGGYGSPAPLPHYDYYGAHHHDDPAATIVSAAAPPDPNDMHHSLAMAPMGPGGAMRRPMHGAVGLPPGPAVHQHHHLHDTMLYLNVGGQPFTTTRQTLLAVRASWFWPIFNDPKGPPLLPKTATGEFFIDRNGQVFNYILEYLRSLSAGEPAAPLPDDPKELQALMREAEFYQLADLQQRIVNTSAHPQPKVRYYYDSLYLETGYNSIEGRGLKEMEQKKVVVMQQLNHVLMQKQADGFFVDWCKCGVAHREAASSGPGGQGGGTQHNLFYHILLKKAVPLLHHLG